MDPMESGVCRAMLDFLAYQVCPENLERQEILEKKVPQGLLGRLENQELLVYLDCPDFQEIAVTSDNL